MKIGLAGLGYWGPNLVRNFNDIGALKTVCDIDKPSLDKIKAQYPNLEITQDYNSLLQDKEIVAIAIATPVQTHFKLAKEAIEAGKHVFVEKPVALNLSEAKQLHELAQKHNKILMVGHLLEYHPAVVKLQELIQSSELGEVKHIRSIRHNLGKLRHHENALWSLGVHDVAVVNMLAGSPGVKSVKANGSKILQPHIDDMVYTDIVFSNGLSAHISVSWLEPIKKQELVVIGSKKMAVFNDTLPADKLTIFDSGFDHADNQWTMRKSEPVVVTYDNSEPLRAECEHFIDCIKNNKTPRSDGIDGIKVSEILEMAQKQLSYEHKDYFVHESSYVDESAKIGKGTKIWHFSHVMKNAVIGEKCNFGQNVVISPNVVVGNNVKIQNNVSVYTGVIIEDDVFCGPSMVFTNVNTPRSAYPRNTDGDYLRTVLKQGCSIGANATIVCGHTLGAHSFVGAGSVVTKDVPDYAMVYGNPARIRDWACECGMKLSFKDDKAVCSECKKEYSKIGDKVTRIK